ncbi:hypothetical protein AURDEDRAFT_154575 [Auricularia subglabra TFB-10046 SS5]|nr:hypothetical protein AURDEDRAFT_154575 [Auricularia subglabra TFB-10046 SS5]
MRDFGRIVWVASKVHDVASALRAPAAPSRSHLLQRTARGGRWPRETKSIWLGYASIACWLGAQFPQLIVNYRNQSADGLALPFLLNWLLGDISNLIGCILTHQLPFQTWLATYFCLVDFSLFSQYFYYDAFKPKPATTLRSRRSYIYQPQHTHARSLSRSYSGERDETLRAISVVAANVAQAAAIEAARVRHHSRRHTGAGESADPYEHMTDSAVSERRVTWSTDSFAHPPHRSAVPQLAVIPSTPQAEAPAPIASMSVQSLSQSRASSRGRSPSGDEAERRRKRSASRRSASIVFLGVWMLFGFADLHTRWKRSTPAAESVGVVLNEPPPEVSLERIIGRISAWTCTTLYLTSRLPQIWKNFVRKSCEGLSMALFTFAFLGNSFYVASILTSPPFADAPTPEARTAFLKESIPYLLGSGGTLVFDITIVIQSFVYAPKPKVEATGAEEEGLLNGDAAAEDEDGPRSPSTVRASTWRRAPRRGSRSRSVDQQAGRA